MDLLCTDKTGTLTQGSISLAATVDLEGAHSEEVAERAAVNAASQTGFTNPLDQAILAERHPGRGLAGAGRDPLRLRAQATLGPRVRPRRDDCW